MNTVHQRKITKFLGNININKIAKETGFQKRKPKKISPEQFLLSFFMVFLKKNYSLRAWAIELSSLINENISFQAIAKKLQIRQLSFVKSIFSKAMEQHFEQELHLTKKKLLSQFSQVLIEDSSCVKLFKGLSEHFPGAKNQLKKKSATCRIQFCFDLKSNGFENITLTSFVKNDLTFAKNILSRIKPNALIIRDLGYLVIDVFREIAEANAFFISRFKTGMAVYDTATEQQIDFIKYLKKLDRNGFTQLDWEVKIGSKKKVSVRMVALKLTPQQIEERRRKSTRRRRGDSTRITKEAKYLMSWNIFITNLKEDRVSAEQIYELYALRWHIEIIFKNWKSNFGIEEILNSFKGENPVKPELLLYLCMSFMVLIYIPKLNHYHKIIFEKHQKHLSPYKFASFIANQFELLFSGDEEKIINLLIKYCCYDKRQDRENLYEKIYGNTA